MTDSSILTLYLAIMLFIVGGVVCIRYFPWRKKYKPVYLTIIIDANDHKTYNAFMQFLSNYDLLDARYMERNTIIRIEVAVRKEDYEPFYKSLQTLKNIEVI